MYVDGQQQQMQPGQYAQQDQMDMQQQQMM
jgi:hypothetical protein